MSDFRSHEMRWIPRALLWADKQGPVTGTAKLTKKEFRSVCAILITHIVGWMIVWTVLLVWFWKSPVLWVGGLLLAFFIPSGYLSYRSYCAAWERDNSQKGKESQVV